MEDDGGGADQEDDKDEIFLRQFPNLSGFYKMNKNLFKRNKGKKGFDITMGPFIAPTCCSMVVNFIQFQLTLSSIMSNKGNALGYWLPELARYDLQTNFFKIEDEESLWTFLNDDVGPYVFQDVKLPVFGNTTD